MTAIGTKFAPTYAWILMDYIKVEFFKSQQIKSLLWKRFTDDVFFIWTGTEENLDKFLEDLHFLNVVIKIREGKITTHLYFKPKNGPQYLHYDSCHA